MVALTSDMTLPTKASVFWGFGSAMSAIERERVYRRHTDNAAAHELYLQGRASSVSYTEANLRAAVASFEQALAIDPSYPLARAGLATALARFSTSFAPEADAARWASRAAYESARATLCEGRDAVACAQSLAAPAIRRAGRRVSRPAHAGGGSRRAPWRIRLPRCPEPGILYIQGA